MRTATSRLLALSAALALAGLPACSPEDGGQAEADAGASADEAASAVSDRVPDDTSFAAAGDSATYWARKMLGAMGGPEQWRETRFVSFRWIVGAGEDATGRLHAWDRHDGRYRLEYERDDGSPVLALFNVNRVDSGDLASAGHVWVGGERLQGAERDSALQNAYGAFVNDSYWLLHPLKYFDPGVHLSWEGRTELSDGRRYPTVHLSFEPELGVTTDEYWGFVDPETGLLHAWQYHLEGREERGDVIRWEGWTEVGDILLAPRRVWPDGSVNIHFEDLAAADTVPEGIFTRDGTSAPGPAGGSSAGDVPSETSSTSASGASGSSS